ncbi:MULTISPECIES: 2-hydroxycarboxylate transporter family protein [Prauserella salsuginis group]|uniref:2-hydroxycarboxylate transporter family protein n=1 Tax=Prauserella salsuginis TaxID=387889 RepID=A0ABW6G0L3_9PSEU|nr:MULTISPECIES: 2-hydroxycarboxylate transporter family protein [Prauserella salsuginis group]MCR3721911.1 Na+/citrate or Na+/malate symporter [Prauserella flava]MCR3735916.1 Na+/citrate or Na+/malate symporter [Prauserella salsuginis]
MSRKQTGRGDELSDTPGRNGGHGDAESSLEPTEPKHGMTIAGLPVVHFAMALSVVLLAAITDTLPNTLVSGFAASMVVSGLLMWLGQRVPVLRDFGLPIILCLFVPATLVYFDVMPASVTALFDSFVEEQGAMDFILVAIIVGAILGMPRRLILKAGIRFVVPVIGTIAGVFTVIGMVGAVIGYGFGKAVLLVAAPVMAGGLPIGAIPMSEMYADSTGGDADAFFPGLVSALLVANVVCIIAASVLNGLGKGRRRTFVGFSGNGKLLRVTGTREDLEQPDVATSAKFPALCQGLLLSGVVFVVATMLSSMVPAVHTYAWMVFVAVAIKLLGLLPANLEQASTQWGDWVCGGLIPAFLVAMSVSKIDIAQVIDSFDDPRFIALILASVLVSGLVAGALGWLLKLYFVESAIVPGLVMADTGGSGDVAVLSAGERMNLLPFATIATRFGGALTLVLTSSLVPVLGGALA